MELQSNLNTAHSDDVICDTKAKQDIIVMAETEGDDGGLIERGKDESGRKCIWFRVEEYPPWHISILYALQQMLANISGPVSAAYIISANICTQGNDLVFAELLSTAVFMAGVCTLLQVTFGIRLPIVQGSAHAFLGPVMAMMNTPQWSCPHTLHESVDNGTLSYNVTMAPDDLHSEPWKIRIREISGSLIAAAVTQVILGCTGLLGYLINYIGPLTIAPTVSMVGLSLFYTATEAARHQWGIAIMTSALIVIFSLLLGNIQIPLPSFTKGGGCSRTKYPVFKLFPHIFAIGLSWILCHILTVTDVFPNDPDELGFRARTDAKQDTITRAKWIFLPYPGMWGTPTISPGVFIGMLAATVSSIIESIGDYYATARICEVPAPPKHAINRGIAMEGLGAVVSGMVYAGHATTSYSGTIGFIGITGMASRVVWQVLGVMLVICGIFGKFGAALSIMPDPIIGGMTIVSLGMVISVGLSTLQFLDMSSPRNLLILGVAMMLGMMLPFWMRENPGIVSTGNLEADQVINVFLTTAMVVGGVTGFLLDNLLPGTRDERGITSLQQHLGGATGGDSGGGGLAEDQPDSVYDLPFITAALRRIPCCKHVPFMPTYVQKTLARRRCCCRG